MRSAILGPGESVLAFDVGGTDIKATLVDEAGVLRSIVRAPAPRSDDGTADAVLARVGKLAEDLRATFPDVIPTAAGLVVPGLVDEESGLGLFSENLGWRDAPLRDDAAAILGLPVSFGHDVRGAGEAEFQLGAAAGFRNAMVLVIGTGIAAAIFIDGRGYSAGGHAGEIGHSLIASEGPLCACGRHGCLEAMASAAAIAREYSRVAGVRVDGAKEVLERARSGDTLAGQVWAEAIDALALGLAQSVAILAPEAIIIGGGLAAAGDDLFIPLASRLDALLTFHPRPQLIPARIGQDAGLIGAALRARALAANGSRP